MNARNKNVLLVEDDLNFGTVLRDYLRLNGYKVVLARNGLEGYEKFKKNSNTWWHFNSSSWLPIKKT